VKKPHKKEDNDEQKILLFWGIEKRERTLIDK
jgi:hypothetical protein